MKVPEHSHERCRAACRAAVYLEMGEYEKCIVDCDTAVEKGRDIRTDYKVIARALTRKANALAKQERYEEAVETYHKSLTEHRYAGMWLILL